MDTARLFQSGRSQAVRLPKDYRFRGSEVAVKHFGNGVPLLPIDDPWQTLEDGLVAIEPGFVLPQLRSWPRPRTLISLRRPAPPPGPARGSGWRSFPQPVAAG